MEKLCSAEGRFILYVFLMHYHGGQWSRGYKIMSLMNRLYRPRITSAAEAEAVETELYYELIGKYRDKV